MGRGSLVSCDDEFLKQRTGGSDGWSVTTSGLITKFYWLATVDKERSDSEGFDFRMSL